MPSGILGKANLTPETDTILYTVPAGKTAAFSVNFCNTAAGAAKVRLALAENETPAAGEYLEYEAGLSASSVLERTGLVLDAGKCVIARADVTGVNVVVYGIEE